jgi:CO/xanthine dehydrogenase Mo-binding subunit
VEVQPADGQIRVHRLVAAVDSGQVINPDGLRNQIEGGMIQSASWTLKEQVVFNRARVTSTDWHSYPILTIAEAPQLDVVIVNRPNDPPMGAGEASQGPTSAAIANAIFAATGRRMRELPITSEKIRQSAGAKA